MSDYLKKRMEHILNDRPLKEKKIYKIPKISKSKENKLKQQKESGLDSGLDRWFEYQMKNNIPVCAECGMEAFWLLEEKYAHIWRACQAHILPKRKSFGFQSISTNMINHLVLFPSFGGHLCGHHTFYDNSWENAMSMKIWPVALEKMKTLLPLINEKELKNIPDILLKEFK